MGNETSALAPSLLVAMPQLLDPNFTRSVVLLCEHNDQGAMGLVVNRPTATRASQIVRLDPPAAEESSLTVWVGGPVEPERGFLLLLGEQSEGAKICPGLYLSASVDRLRSLMESPEAPSRGRLLVGYAGWGPGQLDRELAASFW